MKITALHILWFNLWNREIDRSRRAYDYHPDSTHRQIARKT